MYAPKQFREDRREVLLAAIEAIRFGTLILSGETGPEASHLPMLLREDGDTLVIECHVAVGNPLWKLASTGTGGLAIFQGPQAYMHPGWLETKRTTGKVVPTWNYIAVHVHGSLSSIRDPEWLRRHVEDLTAFNEAGRPEPWAVSDAPDDYIKAQLRGIMGIRLEVDRIEGVWKLMQHHPEANRLGVIAGLSESGDAGDRALAAEMRSLEDSRKAGVRA
jgi:transcriptional regulator